MNYDKLDKEKKELEKIRKRLDEEFDYIENLSIKEKLSLINNNFVTIQASYSMNDDEIGMIVKFKSLKGDLN